MYSRASPTSPLFFNCFVIICFRGLDQVLKTSLRWPHIFSFICTCAVGEHIIHNRMRYNIIIYYILTRRPKRAKRLRNDPNLVSLLYDNGRWWRIPHGLENRNSLYSPTARPGPSQTILISLRGCCRERF